MHRKLIKPPALRPGDTIGVAAPASPFDAQDFHQGVAALESMGYRVQIPEAIFERQGYLAGSDDDRASLLTRLFEDESINAVLCARGGFGSMRLLPLLDFEILCATPKIFVGFSDVSALLVAMYQRCGMVTFHGPLVTTLRHDSQRTRSALTDALASGQPQVFRPDNPVVLNPGKVSGPMIGGNLTSLSHLMGTPFEPTFGGHVLFLEDRGEAPYRIDRMLSQWRLGGHLDEVAGVVLGSFKDCDPVKDVYRIVKETFRHIEVPILAGFDFGHGLPNLTVPIGVEAELDADDGVLGFLESATALFFHHIGAEDAEILFFVWFSERENQTNCSATAWHLSAGLQKVHSTTEHSCMPLFSGIVVGTGTVDHISWVPGSEWVISNVTRKVKRQA